jgi:predicted exporter
MTRASRLALAAIVLGLLGLFVARRLVVTTDIGQFMPLPPDPRKSAISRALATSAFSRTLILSVEASSTEQAILASQKLEEHLRADRQLIESLVSLDAGPPAQVERAVYELLEDHALGFSARNATEAELKVSDSGLEASVRELRRKLSSPLSAMMSRAAEQDPFLTIPNLLLGLEKYSDLGPRVVSGRFIADDRYAIFFLRARASAFDADAQSRVLKAVDGAFQLTLRDVPGLRLESSGIGRFAVRAKLDIERDIERISTLSTLGLLALCLLVFRSLRPFLVAFVPVLFGMLAGTACLLLVFGEIHGITLAFGSSLIGVCVDYVLHVYVHHVQRPDPRGPAALLRKLWPGLWLGAWTTVAGFLVLIGSSFPGLRQAAVFGAVGVLTALYTTRFILPDLMPKPCERPPLRGVAVWLGRMLLRVRTIPGLKVLPLLALVMSGIGIFHARFESGLAGMAGADPILQAEDARVRKRVAHFDQSRFVVSLGRDEEQALRVNDQLHEALLGAVQAGELESFNEVSQLLPSAERQASVVEVFRRAHLRERLGAVLTREGFEPARFESYFQKVESGDTPEPLTYGDFAASRAATLVGPFRLDVGSEVAFLTYLRGIHDNNALSARVEKLAGVVSIDQGALLGQVNHSHLKSMIPLIALGLLAVSLLVFFRYRRIRPALAAVVPALLACGTTVFALAMCGLPINVLSLASLLMVFSMGVDYGIFLIESELEPEDGAEPASSRTLLGVGPEGSAPSEAGVTFFGVLLDWLTTLLGFGVLALSTHPALRTLGLVAAVGVSASLVLAPLAAVMARSAKERSL